MMSRQGALSGMRSPAATDRLFLAIYPDPGTAARIAALADEQRVRHGFRGKLLRAARLHVTLFHFGDWVGLRQDIVEKVTRACSRVEAAPFDVVLDEIASFHGRPGNSPFVLKSGHDNENAALRAFHATLTNVLTEGGIALSRTGHFEPHVTLAYGARITVPVNVAPIAWRVREFVLVHSLLGQTRHIPLARWPLSGA